MTFEQLKALIDDHIELIAYSKNSFREATERTTKFLVVVSLLAERRLELERSKAKTTTLRDAFYAKAMMDAEGKTVTEKKIAVDMNAHYTDQREKVEELDAEISYVKYHIDIFNNAHITYRQMAKGE